jgi:SprT-like family
VTAGTTSESQSEPQPAISEATLYMFFDKLNQTHFRGQVPLSRIKWSDRIGNGKNHRCADFTVFQDRQFLPVIRLSKNLLSSQSTEKVCQVLFYEMIHIWLWNNGKSWGHTPDFHEKAKTFNFSCLELN